MSQIIVDGEDVIFEGDIPQETSQVYNLLMQALSEQARVIYTIEVDDETPEGGALPATYNKIVVTSISHDELTMKLSIESINQMSNTGKHLDAYQNNVLSLAWSEVFKRMNEFIEKIQPFADLLDSILPYATAYSPPWSNSLKQIAEKQSTSLEGILEAFEQGNPALLSDEIYHEFIPIYNESLALFKKDIIPYLKEKVDSSK